MVFEQSVELLKRMEAHVLRVPYTQNRIVYLIQKLFLYPVKYLKVGFDNGISLDLGKFTFLSFAAMLLLAFLVKDLDPILKGQAVSLLLLPVVFFVPLVFTLFPMPSSLATYKVSVAHVGAVIELANNLKVTSVDQLKAISKNISIFEESTKNRTNVLRAIMALLWSFGVYQFNELVKAGPSLTFSVLFQAMDSLSLYFFFVLVMFVLLDSYKKANQIIFKGLAFGLTECECSLSQQIRASNHSLQGTSGDAACPLGP
jgi:hypothetical protein